jgi:predicted nuclease of restriction endonuclease-like (RecB) superfamily
MAGKKERAVIKSDPVPGRKQRGRVDRSVMFPVPPPASDAPPDYAAWLADLKARIQQQRLRVVLASNAVMVLLYWDIGRSILDKQDVQGWGSRVIDRLAADLREAFPEMKGFSPRNLKYMRAFAAAWPDLEIVQQSVAQLSWRHNLALLEKLRSPDDKPTLGLLLVHEKNRVLVEYALGGSTRPISVAEWDTRLTHALPEELQASLPTIEEIEAELSREENER